MNLDEHKQQLLKDLEQIDRAIQYHQRQLNQAMTAMAETRGKLQLLDELAVSESEPQPNDSALPKGPDS